MTQMSVAFMFHSFSSHSLFVLLYRIYAHVKYWPSIPSFHFLSERFLIFELKLKTQMISFVLILINYFQANKRKSTNDRVSCFRICSWALSPGQRLNRLRTWTFWLWTIIDCDKIHQELGHQFNWFLSLTLTDDLKKNKFFHNKHAIARTSSNTFELWRSDHLRRQHSRCCDQHDVSWTRRGRKLNFFELIFYLNFLCLATTSKRSSQCSSRSSWRLDKGRLHFGIFQMSRNEILRTTNSGKND